MVGKKYFKLLFGMFALLIIVLLMYFVLADHEVTGPDGVTSFTVNQYVSTLYNITINNTNAGQAANITKVRVILYESFNFTADTNGTDSGSDTFGNSADFLNWTNSTGYVINGSEAKHFWFNLTALHLGSFKIGVETWNATGPTTTNLTVTVNGIVSGCEGALVVAGVTYTLNQSIGSGAGGNCLTIANESIILDCAGYNITFGNSTGGIGIININVSAGAETGYANVTIRNCIILENSTGFNATAIFFGTDSENATIFNNTITTQGNGTGGMSFGENFGISNISLNTLAVSGNESIGIIIASDSSVSMDSNDITMTGILSTGITFLQNISNSNVTSNNINISVSDPERTSGIYLQGGSNSNLLYNNTITTSGGGIGIEDSTSTNVSSNTIISSALNFSAVYLDNADSSILEHNNITTSDNWSTAIDLVGLINALINLNNITTSNSNSQGMVFEGASDSNITYNTITTVGDEAAGVYLDTDSDNMKVNSNIITTAGNDSSGILMGDNSADGTIFNNTIITTGNLSEAMAGIFLEEGTSAMNVSSNNITMSGINNAGIWVWGSNHLVDSNTITTSGEQGDGIYMEDGSGTNLTSNTIAITGVRADGIHSQMSESSSLLFYSNVITTSANYSYGIYLQGDDYNNISSNNITTLGNASYGIYFNESHSAILSGNIIKTGEADSYVLYLSTASNHSVYNNIFNTSTNGSGVFFDDCSLSYFNTTETAGTNIIGRDLMGGNFWTNSTSSGYSDTCIDADGDYFCDTAYVIYPVKDHRDYLPLADHTNPTYECGTLSTANRTYILNQSITGISGTCFTITADNITLDFAGFNITGDTTGAGVNVTGYNDTTIANGIISNFSDGILLKDNKNNTIINMTSNDHDDGIEILSSSYNNLTDITSNDNSENGIYLSSSSNNTLAGGTLNSNTLYAIYLDTCASNAFTNVNINDSGQDAIYLTNIASDDNNFTNVVVTNTNSSHYDINFASAGIDGTWIENIEFANYSFTGAGGLVNFKEPGFGEIVFLEEINGSGYSLKNDVDIESNWVFVNSSKSGLNKSANITLYDINYTVPSQRQQYSSDDNTWAECNLTSDPACNYFSYDADENILVFNVSHFTYFRATVDSTAPVVTLTESSSTTTSLTITVSKSDGGGSGISSCSSNRGVLSDFVLITETGLTCGNSYSYTVTCTDYAGNRGSDTESFSTDSCEGGGSGTESFWTMTYVDNLDESQEEAGYTKALNKKHRMKVTINDEFHYVGIVELTNTTATINVSSDPYQAVFNIGDEKKFDVTDDDYYDLLVKLNSIDDIKADVTVKYVHEEIPEEELPPEVTECESDADCSEGYKCADNVCEEKEVEGEVSTVWIWIVIVVIILLIVFGIMYGLRKRRARGVLPIGKRK